jgi:AraC family transcriptional activator of mtrCDE
VISENAGRGERLDLLCGHFAIAFLHDRLLRSYLPRRLVVHAGSHAEQKDATAHFARLVALMRSEAADDHLGGRAMLNALSTSMFALVLRLANEAEDAPRGLLVLASHPRLAPAVAALFNDPARIVTARARRPVQQVTGHARASIPGEGRSASDLLTATRMPLAANKLRKSSVSTGVVGYQSEAAFQRAFKKPHGRYSGARPHPAGILWATGLPSPPWR